MDIDDLERNMQFQMYLNLLIMLNWAGPVNGEETQPFENYQIGLGLEADTVAHSD